MKIKIVKPRDYWATKGSSFEIDQYDGAESLHVIGNRKYLVA